MTNRIAHVIGIVIVWAFALCFGWFYVSGQHFRTVAFICSGFALGMIIHRLSRQS